jgi:glucokinase
MIMTNPYKIGIDLGGTNLRVALVNDGKIENKFEKPLENKHDLNSTIDQLTSAIEHVIVPEVIGIGIGVPSVVDTQRGIVYNVANIPSWIEVHLKALLEEKFNLPVYVNNDVNCFVLGEHAYGEARTYSSVVGLTIGTGLGAGIVIKNHLYEGNNTGAGEIGLLPYLEQNIEYYCSSSFFSEIHQSNGYECYKKALEGNTKALEIWDEFGKHFAQAIKCVVLAYDPQMIVVGGSISKSHRFFNASMLNGLNDFPFPKSIEKLKIAFTDNENSNILGASLLF